MPGISRFMSSVLSLVQKHFRDVKVDRFQNPMKFHDTDSFLDYYTSTGLFINSSNDETQKNQYKDKIEKEVQKIIEKEGIIEIMKEVGGILAYKL